MFKEEYCTENINKLKPLSYKNKKKRAKHQQEIWKKKKKIYDTIFHQPINIFIIVICLKWKGVAYERSATLTDVGNNHFLIK